MRLPCPRTHLYGPTRALRQRILRRLSVKIETAAWSRPFHFDFCLPDRVNDIGVGGATAQISTHIFSDGRFGVRMSFVDASHRGEDLQRRADVERKAIMPLVDSGLGDERIAWVRRG